MSRGRGILGSAALAAAVVASLASPAPRASGALGWAELAGATDHAPEGVPDFDQRQTGWASPIEDESRPRTWTHDGPVAAAAALWWLDSRAEPRAFPPPAESDGFGLVTAFGFWDDHATSNVRPLVEAIARASDTNGAAGLTPPYYGTCADDLEAALDAWLALAATPGRFTVRRLVRPTTEQLAAAVRREQAVVLLVGLWQPYPSGDWGRLGGHYVALQAADDHIDRVRLSDPFGDRGAAPVPAELHNRAGIVVHEDYLVAPSLRPGPVLRLLGYVGEGEAVERLVANFQNHNRGDCAASDRSWVPEAPLEAHLDLALVIAPPGSDASPTATASLTPLPATAHPATATAPPTAVASRRPDRETPPAPAPTRTPSPPAEPATAAATGAPGGTAPATETAPATAGAPGTGTAVDPPGTAGPPAETSTVEPPEATIPAGATPGATSAPTGSPATATEPPVVPTATAAGTGAAPTATPSPSAGPTSGPPSTAPAPTPAGGPAPSATPIEPSPAPSEPPASTGTPPATPAERTPPAATKPPSPGTAAPSPGTAAPMPGTAAPSPSPSRVAPTAVGTATPGGARTEEPLATETMPPSPTRPPDRGDARPIRGGRVHLPLVLRPGTARR